MICYLCSRGWPDRKGYRNCLSQRRKVRKERRIEDTFFATTHHASAFSALLREEKNNELSPRRKVRKGISYKNNIRIEVPGDLGAFARKK